MNIKDMHHVENSREQIIIILEMLPRNVHKQCFMPFHAQHNVLA